MNSIWIIDEQNTYRKGLKNILEITFPSYDVSVFPDVLSVSTLSKDNRPDLVIIDDSIDLPLLSKNIDFFVNKDIKVALISITNNPVKTLKLLKKDIVAYFTKSMSTIDLIDAIIDIFSGKKYVHPSIGVLLQEEYKK